MQDQDQDYNGAARPRPRLCKQEQDQDQDYHSLGLGLGLLITNPKSFSLIEDIEQFPVDSLKIVCKLAGLEKCWDPLEESHPGPFRCRADIDIMHICTYINV